MPQIIRRAILSLALIAGLAPAFAQAPPPVPALPDAERRTTYSITGSLCACNVGFALYGDSTDYANWIEVWVNGQMVTQSGNWTITSPTGSLATIPRPISDAVLTFTQAQTGTVQIVGARRPRRTSQFSESRGVAARDLNQVITDIVAQNRETWDKINDVTGRTMLAPPGETLGMLPPAAQRAGMGICFDGAGKLTPCVAIPSSTLSAGTGITLTGTGPTVVAANIQPTAPITITGTNPLVISCPTCSLPTRTAAQALDLSVYTAIQTLGYSTPGDGGRAVFKKIAPGTPFIDSFVTAFTITGGSGYTNGGPYYGVLFQTGTKPYVIGTVNVSGGAVTAANIAGSPGNQCAVGDVYAIVGSAAATAAPANGLPAGGTGAALTVTACSTPLASFTDAAGNRWQFVPDGLGPVITQFGAVGDLGNTDAGATDNFAAVQACLRTAGFKSVASLGGNGAWGGQCQVPQGAFLVCGTGTIPLIIPQGVNFVGSSGSGSLIKFCTAWAVNNPQFELCDPNWHFACFNALTTNIAFRSDSGSSYIGHSNVTQDFGGVYQTYFYSNGASTRGCFHYDEGFGGASKFTMRDSTCAASSPSPQFWIGNSDASGLNLGSTIVEMTGLVLGGNSSGFPVQSGPGILVNGGIVTIFGVHCEQTAQCIAVDISAAAGGTIKITNVNAGNGNASLTCTGVIQFTAANSISSNNSLDQILASGSCSHTVDNGMPAGANYNNGISLPACFKPSFDRAGCL